MKLLSTLVCVSKISMACFLFGGIGPFYGGIGLGGGFPLGFGGGGFPLGFDDGGYYPYPMYNPLY